MSSIIPILQMKKTQAIQQEAVKQKINPDELRSNAKLPLWKTANAFFMTYF